MASRAYSLAHPTEQQDYAAKALAYQNAQKRNAATSAPGAYDAMKMQQGQDYASQALAYMAAMDRNKVAQSSAPQPSAPVTGPVAPFSATGINIVDPQQATTLPVEASAAVAPVPKEDPIEEAYKKYMAGIEANRATNTADSASIKAAIQGYYSKAAEGNKQTYGQSEQDVATMSQNLGTNFAGSREGQIINATARDRQEQLDSMQAHNLSSSDKMAQLQGGVYDAYGKEGELVKNKSIAERTALELQKQMQLQQIQADIELAMMQAEAAASSGGSSGGGGRRGGGGSSSKDPYTTIGEGAEEVSYVNNIGDIEALNSLSPSAQAAFRRIYNLGGGDVTSSLSEGQKLYDLEEARVLPGYNNYTGSPSQMRPPSTQRGANPSRAINTKTTNLGDINSALQALTGISGIFGTPATRQKVTTTAKKTTKKQG